MAIEFSEGEGEAKVERSVTTSFRLPTDLMEQLDQVATRAGCKRNAVVVRLLAEALPQVRFTKGAKRAAGARP